NIYGDRGNMIALSRRAQWRGIDVEASNVSIGDEINPDHFDFFFFGGGQDKQQIAVFQDLQGRKGDAIREAVERGAVILSVCGGYQLLGRYYRPFEGDDLPGIGLFDAHTDAGAPGVIGNGRLDGGWPGLECIWACENHPG